MGLPIAQDSGPGSTPTTISVQEQAGIRSELPQSVLSSGALKIGVGALPVGFPPLVYIANDNKTIIGSEPDLGRLVAAVLGLKPSIENSTWDNLFVGIDSGKVDAGFSNITDTEQRKEKYDFASYRQDNLGFAVKASNTWTFDKSDPNAYEKLAGLTIATDAGTNQEKILLAWQKKLRGEGKNFTVKYFPDANTVFAALVSGQVDAYFSANPGIAYEATSTAGTPRAIRDAGTYSGAGATLAGPHCRHHEEGRSPGTAAGRFDQLPDQNWPVRHLAQGLRVVERGREHLVGKPARAPPVQQLRGDS